MYLLKHQISKSLNLFLKAMI